MTLIEILKNVTHELLASHIENPRLEAEWLIADVLGSSRLDLYLHFDDFLEDETIQKIEAVTMRRKKGEPLPYISQKVEFFDCIIKVTPDVLIPRPETEILVDQIAKKLALESLEGKKLLDLCSGSGCIGIALKKKFPSLDVTLSDISEKALLVAKENSLNNNVQVNIAQGDLLAPHQGKIYDFVVCNPPYVSQPEWESLSHEVKDFEPALALIAGKDGLDIYRRLSDELLPHVRQGGDVFLEIGTGQGGLLRELFQKKGWHSISVQQDFAGHDRFLSFMR